MHTQISRKARLSAPGLLAGASLGFVLAAMATPAFAQSTQAQAEVTDASPEATGMDTIIVTGVRGIERSVIDSPTPIDVVSADALESTGQPDLLAQINTLVPSFNVPAQGGGGLSYVVATGGLRGLNVDQTLVLVNGKRRHRSANVNGRGTANGGSQPVDFSLIPSLAVARVEVLRDGASAQYGSDAIAGVINIITKHSTNEGRITGQFAENFDRSDGRRYQISAFKGFELPTGISLVLAADFRQQGRSNRSLPISDDYRLYFPVDSNGNSVPVGTPGSVLDPREATIDRITSRNDGQAPQNSQTASYDLTVPIGDETEFYSYGMWGHRETILNWSYRPPKDLASLPELYPNGFYPKVRLNESDKDIAGGIRTVVGGWDVDLASTYGTNRVKIGGFDTLNASLGPSSPTEFDYGAHEQNDWNNSLDITRGYEIGGSHLQVSLGLLHRWERFVIEAGDPLAVLGGDYVYPASDPRAGKRPPPGAQGQTAYLESEASDTSRNNFAAYVDLAYDLSDSLFIGAALRQEHFTDSAGDATIFKVTGRYEVLPGLAFRGAVNTGFKAPTPGQSAYGNTSSTFATINGVEDTLSLVKFLPVISDAAIALGAKPLVPEKSLSFSAGLTAEPVQGLTFTIDGYVIKVKDRITLTETLRGPEVQAILEANGITTQIDAARYFTNAIDTRTKGFDAVLAYRTAVGETGTLSSSLSFNYNKTKIIGVIDNPPELDALGPDYVLFGRSVQGAPLRNPKTKAVWTTSYRNAKLGATVQVTRYGSYQQIATDPNDDEIVNGKIITNAEVSYNLTDTLQVAVGANNLFNVYPDWIDEPSVNRGNGFLPGGVGYGISGGSYYVRVGVNF